MRIHNNSYAHFIVFAMEFIQRKEAYIIYINTIHLYFIFLTKQNFICVCVIYIIGKRSKEPKIIVTYEISTQ